MNLLTNHLLIVILIPRLASILKNLQTTSFHRPRHLLLPLDKLHRQSLTRMPRNMTMHKPAPRIIRLERNHQISARRQRHGISAWRIVEIQLHSQGRVGAVSLGEHEGVMSVKVNRVVRSASGVVVEHPVDPDVGVG